MRVRENIVAFLPKSTNLYRYDFIQPPNAWCEEHKSPLYNEFDIGPKNACGAFFFFDDKDETLKLAKLLRNEHKNYLNRMGFTGTIWLTETSIIRDVKMLELSTMNNVVELYTTLWKNGFDIFTKEFHKITQYCISRPLSEIREYVISLSSAEDDDEEYINDSKYHIYEFSYGYDDKEKLCYALQQLTDFDNGIAFRRILKEKKYDGYIFKESQAKTIVLFNEYLLKPPKHTTITI